MLNLSFKIRENYSAIICQDLGKLLQTLFLFRLGYQMESEICNELNYKLSDELQIGPKMGSDAAAEI